MPDKRPWQEIANTDPEIQKWFADLTRGSPIPETLPTADFMQRDPSFDYKAAIEAGARPSLQDDGRFHWPSGDENAIWKATTHPTVFMEINERLRKGIPIPASHQHLIPESRETPPGVLKRAPPR